MLNLLLFFPAISPHATIVGPPALETEYHSRGRRVLASVPHHNQVLRLDLGSLDLAMLLNEEDMRLKVRESLCGAETAGFSIKDAKPCSPGRKVAHRSG